MDFVHNIEMQLAEVELLQSMYSDEEFKLNDILVIEDLKEWLASNPDTCPPTTLSFVLHLNVDFYVKFPHEYPSQDSAEIFVRSNVMKRDKQSRLNKNLHDFINEIFEPDCALVTEVISWIQDNLSDYLEASTSEETESKYQENQVYGRLWLYSHHIYSKTKRKNILDLAKENNLTGKQQ